MVMGDSPAAGRPSVRNALQAALANPGALADLSPAQLDLTLRVARRCRVLGRLAYDLRSRKLLDDLPCVAADQLHSALLVSEARQRVARWELNRVSWALAGAVNAPIVALKGSAYVLAGLPNAAGRLFGDIDLMVPEAELPVVEARLLQRGWRSKAVEAYDDRYYRLWAHELPPIVHTERGVEIDLHHNILMRTARRAPAAALLIEQRRVVPGSSIKVLAPVDMVLHAIVHLFEGGEMDDALRELVDIDVLLRHFGATETQFWDELWPRACVLGLARPTYYGLRYAQQLLGTPIPQRVKVASQEGAPSAGTVSWMDRLVPLALFPQHPDAPRRTASMARLLLYARSHWVKMPPLMLARHLGYKAWVRMVGHPNSVTDAA